ncbi:MAG: cytochrome c [Bacteroidia bacterium]|nr:cytochrome c [Bacteroidia bacterium]
MKNFSILLKSLSLMMCLVAISSFVSAQDQKPGAAWEIPAKYKAMKNTLKGDAASVNVGKNLYAKHCKSCHGGAGLGDGPKASSMKTKIGSFKDAKFQSQVDGTLYYQIFVGRDEMPAFDKKLAEEDDRWALVNFVRSLK